MAKGITVTEYILAKQKEAPAATGAFTALLAELTVAAKIIGQKVNKASTCVYLKHLPTQIEVKCQRERYQALNRYLARQILTNKIEEMIKGKESEEQQRIEKIRRQKRKRSKRAKLKMLEDKKKHSEKKEARRFRPKPDDYEG